MDTEDQQISQPDDTEVSLSSEGERASLLASVMKHDAERKEAQASLPYSGPKPLGPQLAALAASTLLAVYVWFGSPAWIDPDPIPLPSLAEEGAAVRTAVWLGAQQVEAFEARNGRTPNPQEVGSLPPGVRYERVDARNWILAGQGDLVQVTYSSGETQESLLGAVREMLAGGENP